MPRSITSIAKRFELSQMYMANVISETIKIECNNSGTFQRFYQGVKVNPNAKRLLLSGTQAGDKFVPARSLWI